MIADDGIVVVEYVWDSKTSMRQTAQNNGEIRRHRNENQIDFSAPANRIQCPPVRPQRAQADIGESEPARPLQGQRLCPHNLQLRVQKLFILRVDGHSVIASIRRQHDRIPPEFRKMLREKACPQRRWIAARRELGSDNNYGIQGILAYLSFQTKGKRQLT